MTRDEILAMQPGEELDALVAEKVMERLITWNRHFQYLTDEEKKSDMRSFVNIPDYSTDISAAWEVVEKMRERFSIIEVQSYKSRKENVYLCVIGKGSPVEWQWLHKHTAPTAPEAISKAALLAVMDI